MKQKLMSQADSLSEWLNIPYLINSEDNSIWTSESIIEGFKQDFESGDNSAKEELDIFENEYNGDLVKWWKGYGNDPKGYGFSNTLKYSIIDAILEGIDDFNLKKSRGNLSKWEKPEITDAEVLKSDDKTALLKISFSKWPEMENEDDDEFISQYLDEDICYDVFNQNYPYVDSIEVNKEEKFILYEIENQII